MTQIKYRGYSIVVALPTGGKAGKGCNKTSSIRIVDDAATITVRTIRFNMENYADSLRAAVSKAKQWIDEQNS